jgi:hypothetical protein
MPTGSRLLSMQPMDVAIIVIGFAFARQSSLKKNI